MGLKMTQINPMESMPELLNLVHLLETQKEDLILISRNGAPVAELRLSQKLPVRRMPGITKGKFHIPTGYFGQMDREIEQQFGDTI